MKHKKKRPAATPAAPAPAPLHVTTSLKTALAGIKLAEKPKAVPPPPPKRVVPPRKAAEARHADTVSMERALLGVAPLQKRGRVSTAAESQPRADRSQLLPESDDRIARERLNALLAGAVSFDVHRSEDGTIAAEQRGIKPGALERLWVNRKGVDAELDLHGLTADRAGRAVTQFVVEQHRAGRRTLRIIHGKGTHSPDGGVLGHAVEKALLGTAAAPLVHAFSSAPSDQGGTGALLVMLSNKRM